MLPLEYPLSSLHASFSKRLWIFFSLALLYISEDIGGFNALILEQRLVVLGCALLEQRIIHLVSYSI
jgi:hypothetical protein